MKHFPRVAISHGHLVVAGLGTVMWLEWTILEEVRVFKTSIVGESSTLFTNPGVFKKLRKNFKRVGWSFPNLEQSNSGLGKKHLHD